MSSSKVLFTRKSRNMMDTAQGNGADDDDDVWDDRKLNDAYDKALRIANAEVAKRVAMSTNTQPENREDANTSRQNAKAKKEKLSRPSSSKMSNKETWKAGMGCRALWEEDGQEYEAFVLRIINEKECVVRFLGYDNCEIVPINTLKASLGKTERQQQIEQASMEKEFPTNEEWMDESDRVPSPGSTDLSFQRKKKSPKKKKSQKQANFCEMPDMPFQMPNISMMANLGSLDLPMPPPPPMAMPDRQVDSEDQAVSSMLLSWYMSGYYTGLYQGMKRAKQGRRHV